YEGSSYVLNRNGKLPVDTQHSFTPGNSLKLQYTSSPQGNWQAKLSFPNWRGKDHIKKGNELSFWLYVADSTLLEELPRIALVLSDSTQSDVLPTGSLIQEYAYKQWLQVKVSLSQFATSGALRYEHPKEITSVLFMQGASDAN